MCFMYMKQCLSDRGNYVFPVHSTVCFIYVKHSLVCRMCCCGVLLVEEAFDASLRCFLEFVLIDLEIADAAVGGQLFVYFCNVLLEYLGELFRCDAFAVHFLKLRVDECHEFVVARYHQRL